MIHKRRRIAVLAVVCSLLLSVGCGEDDSEDRSAGGPTVERAADAGSGRDAPGPTSENRGSAERDIPAAVRQRRRELDIRPGADNSLQTFGAEPGGEKRSEVVAAMRGFLADLARGDFAAACSDFSEALRESNEELVNRFRRMRGRPPVKGCADLGTDLGRLSAGSGLSGQAERALNGEVLRVGVKSGTGETIVIVRQSNGELVHFPMVREDNSWRPYSIAPKPVRAG